MCSPAWASSRWTCGIAELAEGSAVTLQYERDGEVHAVKATVSRMEKFAGDEAEFRGFGITAQGITGPMALARRYPSTDGVIVTGIRAGFKWEEARPRILTGDVILQIGEHAITDLASFRAALDAVKDIEFAVRYRRGEEHWLTVVEKPDEKPKTSGGELAKAWLGVKTQVCTKKVAEALGQPDLKGFRITLVYPETEAFRAGLRAEDIIRKIDDERMDAYREQDAKDLKRTVEDYPIGDTATIVVWRAGTEVSLKVKLEETPMPASEAESAKDKELEYAVRDLVFDDRVDRRWSKDRTGVVVTEATSGGFAGMAGLHGGDVLVAINEHFITDVKSFERATEALHAARPPYVKLFVHRGFRTHFVVIEPDWAQLEKSK
jgi:serine protease Do